MYTCLYRYRYLHSYVANYDYLKEKKINNSKTVTSNFASREARSMDIKLKLVTKTVPTILFKIYVAKSI